MALLFLDGCGEFYGTSEIEQVWDENDSATVSASGGRRGGAALSILGSNNHVMKGFAGNATMILGVAFNPGVAPATQETFITFVGSGVTNVGIQMTSSGAIRVTRSTTTQIAITAGGVLSVGTWHYIEIFVTIDDAAGVVRINVDNEEVLNETGLDTNNAGAVDLVDGVTLRAFISAANLFDDVYIADNTGSAPFNDFLGDSRIDAVLPDGDGFSSDFDTTFPASPTTHYTKVDETAPNGDTDYNETNTANDIDLFDYAAMPVVAGGATVWAVKTTASLNKQDAGPAPFRFKTRPISTNYDGAQLEPSTDYKHRFELWELNPETAAQWTESEVDAAEFGVEAL